jgi:cell division protein FtsN
MLFGLGLGLVVAVGVYLRPPSGARSAEPPPKVAVAERPAARPASRAASEVRTEPENRFQFYDLLPQAEVVVGDDDTKAPSKPSTSTARRQAEAPGGYLLQVGSYTAAADADRVQASLALLGFESHVQRVTLDGGVFNRVRIGPIVDLDATKRTQRALRAAGYDATLMQVPK